MKIIVCGAGKTGYAIIRALQSENRYEILLVDREESVLQEACNALDVHGVCGDASLPETLEKAGAREAAVLVSVMTEDSVNIRTAQLAGEYGIRHTIARVREPNHRKEGSLVARHLGLRMLVNPEREAAMEIARLLRLPAAIYAETFPSGTVELVAFRVTENDRVLLASPIRDVMQAIALPVLFGFVVRGQETMIPNGDFVMEEGDLVYVLGMPGDISAFFSSIGKYTGRVDRCMIIGGGEIAYYLGKALEGMQIRATIIETEEERVRELGELLPECEIIRGDGTNDRTLLEQHISVMGAVAALTGRDEQNLLICMHAGRMGVSRIIAKLNRSGYRGMALEMGIERIIMPHEIVADRVIEYVRAMLTGRGGELTAMYRLAQGRGEALEFSVKDGCPLIGIPLGRLRIRPGFLVGSIIRADECIVPKGRDHLQAGDSVIVISCGNTAERLEDVFTL